MSYETEERLLTIGKWFVVILFVSVSIWGVCYEVHGAFDCWGKGGQWLSVKNSLGVCLPGVK